MKYPVLILAAVACIAATPTQQSQPTPPPSPPPLTATAPPATPAATTTSAPDAMPAATPSPNLDNIFGPPSGAPQGTKGKAATAPHGTPAPPPQVRKGLDGVWEVEIQRGPKTEYEHMNLVQKGTAISGTYLTKDKKQYPITGSLDDQSNVRMIVSLPDGTTILLEARVEGTTDMLGMFTNALERVPFTAAYRPKENWLENINATPGGMGGGTGGPPGGPL